MAHRFTEHHCLVVFAQDTWKEKDKDRLNSDVKARFLQLGGHSDCRTCGSCPVCRSFEELFDPAAPGPYDQPCAICKDLHARMKAILGKNDGLVLFSHNRPVDKELIAMILNDKRVKKAYVLSLKTSKVHGISDKELQTLKVGTLNMKDFLDESRDDNIIYEVRKERHA